MEDRFESLDQDGFALVHGQGEGLKNEVFSVAVDDDAGKTIAFAPDLAAEIFCEAVAESVFTGHGDAALKEVEVEILSLTGEPAGNDLGATVVDRRAQHTISAIFERDNVAVLGFSEGFEDFGGIDPVVAVKKSGARLNNDACHDDRTRNAREGTREVNGHAIRSGK